MTTPTYSAFTVNVAFQGSVYNVEIMPTWKDDKGVETRIEWIQDQVDLWNSAEATHQVFSRTIVDMLNNSHFPADYSLVTHGLIATGSEDGFTFEKGLSIKHKTQDVWDEFIDCLRDPASSTARVDPVEPAKIATPATGLASATGLRARLNCSKNEYLSLSPDGQKEKRKSLFTKLCIEIETKITRMKLSDNFGYTPEEESCLLVLVYNQKPPRKRMSPVREALSLFAILDAEEKRISPVSLEVEAQLKAEAKARAEEEEAARARASAESADNSDNDSLSVDGE